MESTHKTPFSNKFGPFAPSRPAIYDNIESRGEEEAISSLNDITKKGKKTNKRRHENWNCVCAAKDDNSISHRIHEMETKSMLEHVCVTKQRIGD